MTKYTESVTANDYYLHRDDINRAKIFASKIMNILLQATRTGPSHILKEQEDKETGKEDSSDVISDRTISKIIEMRQLKCG